MSSGLELEAKQTLKNKWNKLTFLKLYFFSFSSKVSEKLWEIHREVRYFFLNKLF